MSVEYTSRSLAALVSDAERENLLLPNFQRQFVWSTESHTALAASVLLDVPCGSLLLIGGSQAEFASRRISRLEPRDVQAPTAPCEYLLDGQQRLTALRQVFGDPFASNWEDQQRNTYATLRVRWSLRLRPASDDPDLFGWRDLRFSQLPAEPDLLQEAFVPSKVLLSKDRDRWFHPAASVELGIQERQLAVALQAAYLGLVPLWGVLEGSTSGGLAHTTIKEIAEARRKELSAQLHDGTLPDEVLSSLYGPGEDGQTLDREKLDERLRDRRAEWVQSVLSLIGRTREFQFAVIKLGADELSKAIVIFEAINRGGTPLTPFDLVAARYARVEANASLPSLILNHINKYPTVVPDGLSAAASSGWRVREGITVADGMLTNAFKNLFLQVLALRQRRDTWVKQPKGSGSQDQLFGVEDTKQSRVLAMKPPDIESGWSSSTDAILAAWRFLQIRCGITSEGTLRNKLLLLPVAMVMDDQRIAITPKVLDRVEYWYWCSVLTDTYTRRQNEVSVADINSLSAWLRDDTENPFAQRETNVLAQDGYSSKDTLLRKAADESFVGADVGLYLLQLSLALGGRDIIENRPLQSWRDDLQDHHLIPLGSMTTVGESSRAIRTSAGSTELAGVLNSPINRTYILAESNRVISDRSIQQYMSSIPAEVKASLHFPTDATFDKAEGEPALEYSRRILGARFDNLRTSVVNRLSSLK